MSLGAERSVSFTIYTRKLRFTFSIIRSSIIERRVPNATYLHVELDLSKIK